MRCLAHGLAGVLALGCTPATPDAPEPEVPAAVVPEAVVPEAVGTQTADETSMAPAARPQPKEISGPLHFVWTDFHFEMGDSAVLEVRDRAVRELVFDTRWGRIEGERVIFTFFRMAEYELDGAEAAALRHALTSSDFVALDASYSDPTIEDGTTQTFTVLAGDHRQTVHCYQRYPGPIVIVRQQIRAIQAAHAKQRDRARKAKDEDADDLRAQAQVAIAQAKRPAAQTD